MAVNAQIYRQAVERLLTKEYDLVADTLRFHFYDDTMTETVRGVNTLLSDLPDSTGELTDVPITTVGRTLTYDADLNAVILSLPAGVDFTLVGDITFRYGLLTWVDGSDEWPLSLLDFGSDQEYLTGDHTLDTANLLEVRLFTALEPAPIGVDVDPLIFADEDDLGWRVFTEPDGTVVVTPTSEEVSLTSDVYLTSPDATEWLLGYDGAVLTAVEGTPDVDDRVFDTLTPCIVPSVDPAAKYELVVSNVGVLSTVLA